MPSAPRARRPLPAPLHAHHDHLKHLATRETTLRADQRAVASIKVRELDGSNCCGILPPPQEEAHPELLSPLLGSSVGRAGLRAHIVMLRTESVQRVARAGTGLAGAGAGSV